MKRSYFRCDADDTGRKAGVLLANAPVKHIITHVKKVCLAEGWAVSTDSGKTVFQKKSPGKTNGRTALCAVFFFPFFVGGKAGSGGLPFIAYYRNIL